MGKTVTHLYGKPRKCWRMVICCKRILAKVAVSKLYWGDRWEVMMKPWRSGSLYYDYKGTCSTVLMALVDADLKFIAIETGSFGRNSDGGIFARCPLGQRIASGQFNFPENQPLPDFQRVGPMPFVAVGDEAFPLLTNLLRPYPGRQIPLSHQLFNYRLSRARRTVENAFGILAARWRVFHIKIALAPQNVNEIVKASSVLHNFIMTQPTSSTSVQQLLEDAPSLSQAEGIRPIRGVGNRAGHEALSVCDSFWEFFAQDNSVSWQYNHVTRGTFENDWSAFMATNIDDCCRHLKIIFIFKLVIMTLFAIQSLLNVGYYSEFDGLYQNYKPLKQLTVLKTEYEILQTVSPSNCIVLVISKFRKGPTQP